MVDDLLPPTHHVRPHACARCLVKSIWMPDTLLRAPLQGMVDDLLPQTMFDSLQTFFMVLSAFVMVSVAVPVSPMACTAPSCTYAYEWRCAHSGMHIRIDGEWR